MAKLSDKQLRFIDEYLIDLNATQAAIRAGYSERTAYRTGADNLTKHQIQIEIQKRQEDRRKRVEITQDAVISELAKIAFADATDTVKVIKDSYIGMDGKLMEYMRVAVMPTNELAENVKAAIATVKQTKNGVEVKMHDKVQALELLGRHLGIFKDKVMLSGSIETVGKLDSILEQLNE